MNNYVSIPVDTTLLCEDDILNMNDINFTGVPFEEKMALIYIRNIGLKNGLSFEQCSYERKCEYLKLFLTCNIHLDIPVLASTWIEILSFAADIYDGKLYQPSIFTMDEIKQFVYENSGFINKVRQFINSISLYATIKYTREANLPIDDTVEYTDDDEIKIINIYQLAGYQIYSVIDEANPPVERRPLYYTKIFDDCNNSYYIDRLINVYPLYQMLSILVAPPDEQKMMVDSLKEFYNKEGESE